MYPDNLLDLLTALGLGLLIGTERSWSARGSSRADLVAGIRTYGLTGLLGGVALLLEQQVTGAWLALFSAFSLLMIAGYRMDRRCGDDPGITSEVALLLTLVLGSLASRDDLLAISCAVVITLVLSLKEWLHAALGRLSETELRATLKLLFISVVLLPTLPNQGYGPWSLLNPYQIWWMVVLIAGIGFAAYVAIRLWGARHGLMITALLGGIVSSTAMTLTLSRLQDPALRKVVAAGLLATSALMFPRVVAEVAAIHPALLDPLIWPLLASGAVYALGALLLFRTATITRDAPGEPPVKNPFELWPALRLAGLLVLILYIVEFARTHLGDAGIYLVALISGLTDVDAITLTLARNAQTDSLSPALAAQGIYLAALSNSLVKGGLILFIGGRSLAVLTLPIMTAGLAVGLGTLWILT